MKNVQGLGKPANGEQGAGESLGEEQGDGNGGEGEQDVVVAVDAPGFKEQNQHQDG